MVTILIQLLLVLVIVGVLYWAATRILGVLPIPEPFRTIIFVVLVLIVVLVIYEMFAPLVGGRRLLY